MSLEPASVMHIYLTSETQFCKVIDDKGSDSLLLQICELVMLFLENSLRSGVNVGFVFTS